MIKQTLYPRAGLMANHTPTSSYCCQNRRSLCQTSAMPLNMPKDELSSWIRLSLEPGLGPAQARHLLAALGLPQDIYAASSGSLAKLLPSKLVQQLRQAPGDEIQETITNTLAWLDHPQHHLLTLADPAYPRSLLDIHDPPLLLYANGNP